MRTRNHERRLLRLEEGLPQPAPEPDLSGWCDVQGDPLVPPENVRRQAEAAATEPWRAAVWIPEQQLVMLLLEGRYEFQIVELEGRERPDWWPS